jgi:hypothetical protein
MGKTLDRPDRARVRHRQPSASWVLKSVGELKRRPGRNEVSKNPLLRSTMPLNSGSRGGANRIRWPGCRRTGLPDLSGWPTILNTIKGVG